MPLIQLLALAMILATSAEQTPIEFTKDSLEVVQENVARGDAVLVDVRSQEEWDDGHLEDSIFLPSSSIRKRKYPPAMVKALPKDKIIYTFCVVGMRAKRAAAALGKDYEVRALQPGYEELIQAGFKKAETKKSGDENTRQRNAG